MSRSTVVIDACLAITHGNARALDLLTALHRHDVVIARRAVGEVTRQPAKGQLAKAIACGHLGVAAIEPQDADELRELARFDGSARFRGRGDAELLALACARGWIVGSDDVAVRRSAVEEFGTGRVAGTLDFLRWAVAEDRMTVKEAVERVGGLDVGEGLLRRLERAERSVEEVLESGN